MQPQFKVVENEKPIPPAHLRETGTAYWCAVVGTYELEDHHLAILATAAEALDRAAEAREVIEKSGVLLLPKSGGMVRLNPAVRVERDAQMVFLRAQKELGLDLEPPGPVGRPPGR